MAKKYLDKLSAFIGKATSDCFDGAYLSASISLVVQHYMQMKKYVSP